MHRPGSEDPIGASGNCTSSMDTIEEESMDLEKAVKFLKSYGYLPKADEVTVKDTADELPEPVKTGIIRFQSNYGLEENGLLDEATIENMKVPRCTVSDKERSEEEALNYTLMSKWDKKKMTWKITKYPASSLSETECRKTIKQALQMWRDNADLEFIEAETEECDLEIRWESGDHGDGDPFDQGGGTLAHAFLPSHSGRIN